MRCAIFAVAGFGFALLLSWSGGPSPAQDHIAKTDPRTPEEEQKCFHLPPGFAIELVAAEPAIRKPINMNFDDRGRLWVTESVEYPFAAPPDRKARDVVKILENATGNGKADKVTVFADNLNIPIGVMPITNGAIVYSIPNIYRVLDTQGKGQADKREVLYSSFGHRDTHGMSGSFNWGFDGWLYAHHGFSNTSTVKGADGVGIQMQSGNTYRMRPDGSHCEQYTWGQVNPFGLCFDPLGNLYSADCHSRPAYQLLRGAYYPSFGKPHDGLGFGPEMMTHDHGSTAICGIVYYAADQFPKEWHDTLFIGNVVTNRINHDRLERHGSTYRAIQQPDFLRSDDPWFRPVDIKLGPDGALYVADFYNRIIGHYEVPLDHPGRDRERGRIWRIVYRGTDGQNKAAQPHADFAKETIAELVNDLAHPNLTVRMKATNQLVERGEQASAVVVKAIMQPRSNPWQRMHGLWVLERLGVLDDPTLIEAAQDKESGVRVHAQRVLTGRRALTPSLRQLALAGLKDSDAFVQRCAAEALGTHPSPENLRPLLDLRHKVPADDTHLLHALRIALRDQLRPADHWKVVAAGKWSAADLRAIAEVALGVPSAESAAFLLAHLPQGPELMRQVHHIARHGAEGSDKALLTFAQGDRPTDLRHQAALFKAIQQGTQERGGKLGEATRGWAEELTGKMLAAKDTGTIQGGVELAGSLQLAKVQDTLVLILTGKEQPEPLRVAAINALLAINPKANIEHLGRVLGDASEPAGLREQTVQALARINQPEARSELLKWLPSAPARLQSSIAAGLASSPQGAEMLLQTVTTGKASARLLQEQGVQVRLNQSKLPNLKERIAKLTKGLPPAEQRFQELIKIRNAGFSRAKADIALGAKIYEKHCAACHQVANKGSKIGPQLDGVGIRGVDRLLEDILDPNRNVDQAFRATTIVLKNGQIVNGLVLREEGEVVVLADTMGKEVRVTKGDIEERTVSQLSPMPANLADQIPEADFYHLLAFLLAQRQPSKDSK